MPELLGVCGVYSWFGTAKIRPFDENILPQQRHSVNSEVGCARQISPLGGSALVRVLREYGKISTL